MTFPQTPLDVRTELQINSVWTDITGDVYTRAPISIDRGAKDEGTSVDPSQCSLVLNNRSGKYSPRNPMSPYYGLIGRNTPLRVSVPGIESYLGLDGTTASYARTPDTAALDIVGDLDIRVEATADWTASRSQSLIGKWISATNQRSYLLRLDNGQLTLNWSTAGTSTLVISRPLPALPRRAALRATLDVDNGAGGFTVAMYWAESMDGPWTPINAPFTTTPATSIFAGTAPLEVAPIAATGVVPIEGRVHRAEVRSGIGGTVVAAPDFRALAPGTAGFTDSAGRVWTLAGAAEVSNRQYRFMGEVSSWPPRWDVSGKDVWVPVEAAGILRRLGQGKKALASTLRRRLPTFNPVAYWPMEDGRDAIQAYSPMPGVAPLTCTGMSMGADDTLNASSELPTLGSASVLAGPVPSHTATGWQIDFMYRITTAPATAQTLLEFATTGSPWTVWRLQVANNVFRLIAEDGDGATTTVINGLAPGFFGSWARLQLWATPSGADINIHAAWVIIGGSGSAFNPTVSSATAGRITKIQTAFGADLQGAALGHLMVFGTSAVDTFTPADSAFAGETTINRLARLASEESETIDLAWIDGDTTAASELMGPQRPNTLLDLLDECENTDDGILHERLDRLALLYRDRSSLYNQEVALALDYTAEGEVPPPLEPSEDDQRLRNDVTISRSGGSSGRTVQEDGPLSVQRPPAGVGVYDEAVTLSLYNDSQPEQIAAWRVHVGTWDEARYPTIAVWLHAAPHLIPDVLDLDIGDRLTIANPPSWLAPGLIDQHIRGYTEVLGLYEWVLTLNCSPAGPWEVGVRDDAVRGLRDTAGSQLAAAVTSSATALSVATTSGPFWTTDPREYPLDLTVGGEVVTAVAAGTVLTPNSLLLTNIAGWTPLSAVITYSTAVVHTVAGATASLLVTPTGATSASATTSPTSPAGSVTPGQTYTMCGWVYSPAGWSDMRIVTDWHDSADVFIATSPSAAIPVPAGQWTWITVTATAPASASRARVRIRVGASPAVTDISYWWGVRLIADASVSTVSPQTMTVVRSRNGITKSHTAGTSMSLARPAVRAL